MYGEESEMMYGWNNQVVSKDVIIMYKWMNVIGQDSRTWNYGDYLIYSKKQYLFWS